MADPEHTRLVRFADNCEHLLTRAARWRGLSSECATLRHALDCMEDDWRDQSPGTLNAMEAAHALSVALDELEAEEAAIAAEADAELAAEARS